MFLSRLLLSQRDLLINRYFDEYGLHQLVYSLFPNSSERDFLYFVDHGSFGNVKIIIQSLTVPEHYGIGRLDTRTVPDEFYHQNRYFFRVRVNPVVKCSGKMIRIEGRTQEAAAWLCRRADTFGVRFEEDTIDKESGGIIRMRKQRDSVPITISYADMTGILEVVDRDKFLTTVSNGIGGHKGFGFGLLQLRPIKEAII